MQAKLIKAESGMDKQIEKVEDAIKKTDAMKEKMTDAQAEVGTMAA